MLVDLPMTLTPLDTPPSLQYMDGLIAHLDSVVQQYIEGRSLQPLRVMLSGSPAVGKSSLAARRVQQCDPASALVPNMIISSLVSSITEASCLCDSGSLGMFCSPMLCSTSIAV